MWAKWLCAAKKLVQRQHQQWRLDPWRFKGTHVPKRLDHLCHLLGCEQIASKYYWKWQPSVCLLGKPYMGKVATPALTSRRCPTLNTQTKSRVRYQTPAISWGPFVGKMATSPTPSQRGSWGSPTSRRRPNITNGYFIVASQGPHVGQRATSPSEARHRDKIRSCHYTNASSKPGCGQCGTITLAFSGVPKRLVQGQSQNGLPNWCRLLEATCTQKRYISPTFSQQRARGLKPEVAYLLVSPQVVEVATSLCPSWVSPKVGEGTKSQENASPSTLPRAQM